MKKFTILFLLAAMASFVLPTVFKSNEANAQIVTLLKPTAANDTLTNADTAEIYVASTAALAISGAAATDNITRSITAVVTKVSGTVAGTVALYGTNDGTNWEYLEGSLGGRDSLELANQTTNVYTFPIRSNGGVGDLIFRQYKLVYITSGTCVVIPKAYVHRRSN